MIKNKLINTYHIALPILLSILIGFYSINANAGFADDIIGDVDGKVNQLIDRTSGLRGRTTTTLEEVQEIGDTIQNARMGLTSDLIAAIQNGVVLLNEIIENEKEGLASFLDANGDCSAGSECFAFRNELNQFLINIETINNMALSLHGNPSVNLEISLQLIADFLDRVPGPVLYPAFVALTSDASLLNGGFAELLDEAVESMAILEEPLSIGQYSTSDLSPSCEYIVGGGQDRIELLEMHSKRITLISVAARSVGKILVAAGSSGVSGRKMVKIGIHGYPGLAIESDYKTMLGKLLGGIGEALGGVSDYAHNKLRYCVIIDRNDKILAKLDDQTGNNYQEIIENQSLMIQQLQEIILMQQTLIDSLKPDKKSSWWPRKKYGNKKH